MSEEKYTKPCPQCGHMMLKTRHVCPECGYTSQWFKVRFAVGCVSILFGLFWLAIMLLSVRGQ
jgi:endogenous inhibitor of DNA gyrase (YacG/DUF329 family)